MIKQKTAITTRNQGFVFNKSLKEDCEHEFLYSSCSAFKVNYRLVLINR